VQSLLRRSDPSKFTIFASNSYIKTPSFNRAAAAFRQIFLIQPSGSVTNVATPGAFFIG
jgi:hypothetical protein